MAPRGPRPIHAAALLTLVVLAGCAEDVSTPVATDDVRIPGAWVFVPEVIVVTVGTTVTWTNDGGQPHTVTFADDAPARFDVTIEPGQTVTYTFDTPGEYPYECTFHPPDMRGRVVVEPGNFDDAAPPANASLVLPTR